MTGQRFETGEADPELPAAFGSGEVVNLVNDHRLHRAKHGPEVLATEHELEGFGCGHKEVGRVSRLLRSLGLAGVAVADIDPQAHSSSQFPQPSVNVPVEGS